MASLRLRHLSPSGATAPPSSFAQLRRPSSCLAGPRPLRSRLTRVYALSSNDIRVGSNLEVDGAPWKIPEASISKETKQFTYKDGAQFVFMDLLPVNERDAGVAVDDIAELVQELVLHLGDVPLHHLAHHLAGVEVAVVADHLRAMEPLVVVPPLDAPRHPLEQPGAHLPLPLHHPLQLPLQLLRQYARLGAADELLVLALLPPEVFHPLPRRHVVVELELIAVRPRHGAAHVDALEVFDRGPLGLGVGDGEAERAVRLGLGLEGDVVEHAGGGERVELVAQLRPGVDAAGAQRIPEASISKETKQFTYKDGAQFVFMDLKHMN
uniref:Translation elongation factor P/YeiP central domain-containing protein n=1 Tax=Oryza rufipogon TaxID=4529 RepID=A0A0E0R3F1_ORYRU